MAGSSATCQHAGCVAAVANGDGEVVLVSGAAWGAWQGALFWREPAGGGGGVGLASLLHAAPLMAFQVWGCYLST